jgi:hypothetical protein
MMRDSSPPRGDPRERPRLLARIRRQEELDLVATLGPDRTIALRELGP